VRAGRVVLAAVLLTHGGCAKTAYYTVEPMDASLERTSVAQARETLAECLRNLKGVKEVRDVRINRTKVTSVGDGYANKSGTHGEHGLTGKVRSCRLVFANLKDVALQCWRMRG
jgi:hypothetical protein